MTAPAGIRLDGRQLLVGCAIAALVGACVMLWLYGSGLTSPSKYHRDLTQSPHWMAYHGTTFPEDDLLVRYGRFNESPVQNAIYWTGTLFVDIVLFEKLFAAVMFGLTAALFFGLVTTTSGVWAGSLAALFFMVFPRGTYEIAGGFSKSWAIGFVLLAVWVLDTGRYRVLTWSMPFAALAYPVSPVLMGAIVSMGLVLQFFDDRAEALRGLKFLAIGSALALVPLLYKYFTPPEFIGEMFSTAEMRAMWERGESSSYTIPLWEEVLSYFEHAFFVYGGIALLAVLARRGLVWRRSWTAVLLASAISYHVADLVVPQLYLPDRYSRYSVAVLLVLWFAHNAARAIEPLSRPLWRGAAVAGIVLIAAFSFDETFRPCTGDKDQGVWEDRSIVAGPSRYLATVDPPVLVAGHPYHTSGVMVQARRPVLIVHRMYHAWFRGYRALMQARIEDTFRALYSRDLASVNALAERYGVTHVLVYKPYYHPSRLRGSRLYREEFEDLIDGLIGGRAGGFVLAPPPRDAVVYEDDDFWLVELPLG